MNNFIQIASFALGTGMQAALGFLSVPLLVRALGVEELGRWSIVEAMFQFGAQLALLGFNQTIVKFISADGLAPWPSLVRVGRSLLPLVLVLAGVAGLIAFLWAGMPVESALAVGLLLCLESWMVLGLSTARAAAMPLVFSTALITRSGIILGVLSIMVFLRPGWIHRAADVGWIWVAAYSMVGVTLASFISRRGQAGAGPDRRVLIDGLRYGAPLLLAVLFAQALQYADRFFVSSQLGYGEAGRYFVHAKVANTLAMAALPIQLWWPVARFTHLKDADGGAAFFARASLLGVTFFSVVLLGVAAIGPVIFRWFAPGESMDIWLFLLMLCGQYLQVSAVFFNVGLLNQGTTYLNAVVWAVTAVAQLTLQTILVPRYGVLGAAVGQACGALCALGLQYTLSQRRRFVRYPLGSLAAIIVATVFVATAALRGSL
jgi:O-antigen/teichoic acid export membrane protein